METRAVEIVPVDSETAQNDPVNAARVGRLTDRDLCDADSINHLASGEFTMPGDPALV